MEVLTNQNYEEYLRSNYDCHFFDEYEFKEDLSRIKHIKKLITRYVTYGPEELRERLILNHIIVLNNMFGPDVTSRIIFLKMPDILSYIKPFMILLGILPNKIFNVQTEGVIDTNEIIMDRYIIEALRKI